MIATIFTKYKFNMKPLYPKYMFTFADCCQFLIRETWDSRRQKCENVQYVYVFGECKKRSVAYIQYYSRTCEASSKCNNFLCFFKSLLWHIKLGQSFDLIWSQYYAMEDHKLSYCIIICIIICLYLGQSTLTFWYTIIKLEN